MIKLGSIRFAGSVFGFVLGLCGAPQAFAQAAPPAQQGFQMAFRTGFAIPLGAVAGSAPTDVLADEVAMSDLVAVHVPIIIDIGGKVSKNVFLGGYLGLSFGGAGGDAADTCDALNASCASAGFRFGAQVHYQFQPAEKMNPWIGYGIGFESLAFVQSRNDQEAALGVGGFEFAHLMAGLDFRLSHGFGIGPFVDFSMGSYSRFTFEADGLPDADGDIDETALHEWLMVGARFVILP